MHQRTIPKMPSSEIELHTNHSYKSFELNNKKSLNVWTVSFSLLVMANLIRTCSCEQSLFLQQVADKLDQKQESKPGRINIMMPILPISLTAYESHKVRDCSIVNHSNWPPQERERGNHQTIQSSWFPAF